MSVIEPYEALIEAYLDGDLGPDETLEVERALVRPEVAALLSRALMVRELLRTAPPEGLPEGLLEEIHTAVQAQLDEVAAGEGAQTSRFPRLRAALSGAAWGVRGPAMAVATSGAGRTAMEGLSSMRSALEPLTGRGEGGAGAAPIDKRAIKRAKKAKKEAKKIKKAEKKAKKAKKKAKRKKKGGGLLRRLLRGK